MEEGSCTETLVGPFVGKHYRPTAGDLSVIKWIQDKEAVRDRLALGSRMARNGGVKPILATVSGVLSTKTSLVRYADRELPAFGIITTKSYQVVANPGNREPIICEMEVGSYGNSVGLKNPGMAVALAELTQLRNNYGMRALLNVSVSASNAEDFITLVQTFESVADIIELNFSCPHASVGYGASIGCSPEISALYIEQIKKACPNCGALIFAKLTPNVPDIGEIAMAVKNAGADGITAINTVGPEVHIQPHSGKPILQNKLGGKGGKSGNWIREQALACIGRIREVVGEGYPIIGMGGVSTGADVAAMILAGADSVGVGSAFGKVHQKHWRAYSDALALDCQQILSGQVIEQLSPQYYGTENTMIYENHTITKVMRHSEDIVVITLDGRLDYDAGQFVFLWIPGVGEKPFSVAEAFPLTFVIKRRGPFTEALFSLCVGDTLYVRGLYGAPVEIPKTKKALLVAGGTGVAVLPALAQRLSQQGTCMEIYIGTSMEGTTSDHKALLEDTLCAYGKFVSVADNGIPGRVLGRLYEALNDTGDLACFLVGPEKFMALGAEKIRAAGVPDERILLSMELKTLCGIGMCGECACGDRLTCQWGTFIPYDYLLKEAPELI
jgi:dihydroorotate dehydrogenase electron transfer subunit